MSDPASRVITEVVQLRVPAIMMIKLRRLRREHGFTLAEQLRRAIEQYIRREERKKKPNA